MQGQNNEQQQQQKEALEMAARRATDIQLEITRRENELRAFRETQKDLATPPEAAPIVRALIAVASADLAGWKNAQKETQAQIAALEAGELVIAAKIAAAVDQELASVEKFAEQAMQAIGIATLARTPQEAAQAANKVEAEALAMIAKLENAQWSVPYLGLGAGAVFGGAAGLLSGDLTTALATIVGAMLLGGLIEIAAQKLMAGQKVVEGDDKSQDPAASLGS